MMVNSKKRTQEISKVLITILIFVLFISSCIGRQLTPFDSASQTSLPPSTPTCVPNMAISTPADWESKRVFYVILFDPSTTAENFVEYQNGEGTQNLYEFVQELSKKLINLGNQVSVFQLGQRSYESARYLRLESELEVPLLYNTPSFVNTPSPIPVVVSTDLNDRAIIAATNQAAKTQTAVAITATTIYSNYLCEIKAWNDTVGITATYFKEIEKMEKATLAAEIVNSNDTVPIETPYSKDVVFEGLYHATIDLNSDCPAYDECVLIIIDDLKTWTFENQLCDDCQIDLSGLDKIYAIMPDCRDINQPSCKKIQDFWNERFLEYGYGFPSAEYHNGAKVEKYILESIGD